MIVRATTTNQQLIPVQGLSIYIKKRNYQIPTSAEINVQRENSFHNAQTPKTKCQLTTNVRACVSMQTREIQGLHLKPERRLVTDNVHVLDNLYISSKKSGSEKRTCNK